jgi:seryl-tRNA synthetase
MLDIKLFREKPEIIKKNLKRRGDKEKIKWVDDLVDLDKKWRTNLKEIEKLRHKRNEVTREIAQLKMEKKPASKQIKE